jgi:simple sugar transport system permease protein
MHVSGRRGLLRTRSWGMWLAAAGITLVTTASLFLIAGANPVAAWAQYLIVPWTTRFSALEVLVSATPILLTGVSVAIAFRAGFWNIGAEGQLLAGAIGAAFVGPMVGGLPSVLAIPLVLLAGAVGGALWVLGPALLRVRLGIDEVVTTLLLNPVALLLVEGLLHGPWRDPSTGIPQSPLLPESAQLPDLLERSRLDLGFIVALVVIAVTWFVLARTPVGLRIRALGLSPHAARFAGIEVERTLLRVALTSGAIAGIAGACLVSGVALRLTPGISSGFGYTGIVVAMLGGLTMPGVLAAGLLLGTLDVGASAASRSLGIPSQVGAVVQGLLLLVTVALLAIRRTSTERSARPPDDAEPEAIDPTRAAPVEASPT